MTCLGLQVSPSELCPASLAQVAPCLLYTILLRGQGSAPQGDPGVFGCFCAEAGSSPLLGNLDLHPPTKGGECRTGSTSPGCLCSALVAAGEAGAPQSHLRPAAHHLHTGWDTWISPPWVMPRVMLLAKPVSAKGMELSEVCDCLLKLHGHGPCTLGLAFRPGASAVRTRSNQQSILMGSCQKHLSKPWRAFCQSSSGCHSCC